MFLQISGRKKKKQENKEHEGQIDILRDQDKKTINRDSFGQSEEQESGDGGELGSGWVAGWLLSDGDE